MYVIAVSLFTGGWVAGTVTQTIHAKYIADAKDAEHRALITAFTATTSKKFGWWKKGDGNSGMFNKNNVDKQEHDSYRREVSCSRPGPSGTGR